MIVCFAAHSLLLVANLDNASKLEAGVPLRGSIMNMEPGFCQQDAITKLLRSGAAFVRAVPTVAEDPGSRRFVVREAPTGVRQVLAAEGGG
jgi:hypothetical protein